MAFEIGAAGYPTNVPQGYIQGQELTPECAPAPLDEQLRHLLQGLTELAGVLDGLESSLRVRALRPDKPERLEGLTALLGACHNELGSVRISVNDLAARIGRL